jgi:hypothetical protein
LLAGLRVDTPDASSAAGPYCVSAKGGTNPDRVYLGPKMDRVAGTSHLRPLEVGERKVERWVGKRDQSQLSSDSLYKCLCQFFQGGPQSLVYIIYP